MSNKKIVSALCYFSIFFFPLLIPVVIFLATDDSDIKHHAKRSFISHLIPTLLLIIGAIIFFFSMFSVERRMMSLINQQPDFWTLFPMIFTMLYSVLFLATMIWNVFQGIQVLK